MSTINSGGNVCDVVFAPNCCMAKRSRVGVRINTSAGGGGGGQSVKPFEQSNAISNIPFHLLLQRTELSMALKTFPNSPCVFNCTQSGPLRVNHRHSCMSRTIANVWSFQLADQEIFSVLSNTSNKFHNLLGTCSLQQGGTRIAWSG